MTGAQETGAQEHKDGSTGEQGARVMTVTRGVSSPSSLPSSRCRAPTVSKLWMRGDCREGDLELWTKRPGGRVLGGRSERRWIIRKPERSRMGKRTEQTLRKLSGLLSSGEYVLA